MTSEAFRISIVSRRGDQVKAKPYIGTSGYQYDHWRDVFYPEDLPKAQWFDHYAKHFDTVEINNTFYALPERKTFDNWRERAPENFFYILKFSRYGSHLKCLKDPRSTIDSFMERATRLGPLLGPILVQLKPNWNVDVERLEGFLATMPADQRWAFEFRNDTWLCEDVFELLRRYNAALCIHDMLEDHPDVVTTGWIYLRFHGVNYGGSYSHQFLSAKADYIDAQLSEKRDVYAYFNNDMEGYAVQNALDLKRYLQNRQEE